MGEEAIDACSGRGWCSAFQEGVGGSGGWKWWVEVVGGSGGWKWDQMTKDKHTLSMFKKQNGRRVQLAVGELSRK